MRRNHTIAIILAAAIGSSAAVNAQTPTTPSSKSFADFRNEIMSNYKQFKEDILADYAKFLDGEWVEYKSLKGEKRDPNPKPAVQPECPEPAAPQPKPASKPTPTPKPSPAPKPSPTPKPSPAPKPTPVETFDFHGMPFAMPQTKLHVTGGTVSDFGAAWRALAKDEQSKKLVDELRNEARDHGFNDYLTFEMVKAYAAKTLASSHNTARTSLIHFIMANMGYDVRLAKDQSGNGLLLVPFRQTVYGRPYLVFNNEKYYVFTDAGNPSDNMRISTCTLPSDAKLGEKLDLQLGELKLPYKPYKYTVSYGDMSISGEINANIFPVLQRYPQMDIAGYAQSSVAPQTRREIVSQLKSQLPVDSLNRSVDRLLQFVQSGFDYATDDVQFGYEKPFFLEELLFYPKCDCEDRVIFYTYMLWNVLGVENHLINYPGHESAAVKLHSTAKGDRYSYENSTYYISDPTYIGARTGMCMPNYRRSTPNIDYIYK